MKKVFGLLILVLFIYGCSSVREGVVVAKDYIPCEPYSQVNTHGYDVDIYSIKTAAFYTVEIKGKNQKGKVRSQIKYVSRQTFDTIKVGTYYADNN